MRKLLLLGSLLATISGQAQETAQTTYYWPGERVTTLQSGTQYFIYNTARSSDNYPYRSFFLYSDGNWLKSNNQIPTEFITTEKEHIFTLEQPASPSAESHWYIKSIHGNVGIAGQTNNTENRDIYITYWATANEDISQAKAGVSSLDEAGNPQNPNEIDTKTWLITKAPTYSDVSDFAWNGNGMENNVLGKGGQWVKYQKAHPYAFYTVQSQTVEHVQEQTNRNGLISNTAFNLQKAYGLVQDGDKYYCNYPTSVAGENSSYANLIDGNDNTKFHTGYNENDGGESTDKHYLRAELPEAKDAFYFITKRRTDNNANRPTTILIEGSNDGSKYEEITTVSGLPTDANEYFYFSGKISASQAYKYIRFTPTVISGDTKFFTYSEFYVIESNEETDKIMTDISNFRNYDILGNIKNEDVATGFKSLYQTVSDDDLNLVKKEAQSLLVANASNHATTPELGQYPTEAYNTFKAAVSAAQTSEEVASAIKTFKFSINAPVFTINGAFNGDYNTTGKSIYYAADDATYPWRWDKATNKYDATMLWKFVEGTSSSIEKDKAYTVTNLAGDLYFWNATAVIVSDPTGDNPESKILIKLQGQTDPVHADRHGYTLLYNATDANSASAWTMAYVGESFKIDQVNEEQLAAYAQLKTLVPQCEPYSAFIGTGLGKFTCESHDFNAALTAAKDIIAKDLYAEPSLDAITALNDLQAAKEALVINQPEPGKFYRIKGASGKYISSEKAQNSKLKMTDATDATTALFITADNRITTANLLNMSRAGVHEAGLGGKFKFTAHQEIGKYVITPTEGPDNIGGTTLSPLYDNSAAANNSLDQWNDASNANCAWVIEEVTEPAQQPTLSRTIGDAGYATLGAPVALKIPEGVKAYTVTVNEDQNVATLHEVKDGIIPAGCGVVLEKTDEGSEYNFTFAAEAEAIEGNKLVPLYTETTLGTDINAYILATKSGLGFYQLDPESRTIGANKAYLKLPATMNHVRSITIGGPTTGIEETVANGNETEEYYDLQGRRVQNPTKGIYVTKSGKKVIINK